MLILSLQPLAWLDDYLQPLAWLTALLLGWLDASLYRYFDISFVRVFSAVRISINIDIFLTFKATTVGMVATIGGKLNQPDEIGTVKWTWKDDGGAVHT